MVRSNWATSINDSFLFARFLLHISVSVFFNGYFLLVTYTTDSIGATTVTSYKGLNLQN